MLKLFDRNKIPEEKLVDEIRSGSQRAMKHLYDCCSGYLLAVCTRYIPDREIAEDILQDSFVKIFASMDKFRSKGSGALMAWMRRITVNEALMYLRRQKKFSFLELADNIPDIPDEEPQTGNIPPEVIQKMIQELSDGYRTVFNLVVFEGKSHREIAQMLGITESTSASQFHRARKILAGKIMEYNRQNESGLDR